MKSPWLVADMQDICPGCQWSDSVTRIDHIKQSTDAAWLRKVLAWPNTQKTVLQAAARRLRKLERGAK